MVVPTHLFRGQLLLESAPGKMRELANAHPDQDEEKSLAVATSMVPQASWRRLLLPRYQTTKHKVFMTCYFVCTIILDLSVMKISSCVWATCEAPSKDENGKEIFRTEPHRFLHLIRANSYFRTKYGILNSNSKYEILNSKSDRIRFRLCSADFYFSTFYSESSVF